MITGFAVLIGLIALLSAATIVLLLGHFDDLMYAAWQRRLERKRLEKLNKAYDKRFARRGLTKGWWT